MFVCCKIIFILVSLRTFVTQANIEKNSSLVYGKKCVWSTIGGNLSAAKEACNEDGGEVFTFKEMSESADIVGMLNSTNSTPLYIGAMRTNVNGTLGFDWLSRPGTWSRDLTVDLTLEEETGYHVDNACIQLLQRNLSLTNCSQIMEVTICESENIRSCYNKDGSQFDFEEARPTDALGDNITAHASKSSENTTVTSIPSIALVSDEQQFQGSNCLHESCPSLENNSRIASDQLDITNNEASSTNERNTESTSTKASNLEGGELMLLPSENGYRITNFSSLLAEIVEKSNLSKSPDTPKPPSGPVGIAGPSMTTNTTGNRHSNLTNGTLVREVQFHVADKGHIFNGGVQVSGLNSGSVHPYTPLLLDQHIHTHNSQLLENTSRILKTLKQEKNVDKSILTVFANTVQATADDQHISEEPVDLRKDLFSDIMCVGETLVENILESEKEITFTTDKLILHSKVMKPDFDVHRLHLEVDQPVSDTKIQLSKKLFENDIGADVRVSTIAYKKMESFVKASNKHISSPVVSVTVQFITGNKTSQDKIQTGVRSAIRFEMKTEIDKNRKEDKRICSYWDFKHRRWSSFGCSVISTNITHTKCECNHLTNFAILVMYIETENISLHNQQALFTLTTVGCSLSIACLAMALICYIYLKMLSREKIMIHANLSVALLLGQIVFVASSDAHRDHIACKTVAILLHYLYMASFTWMMIEGVALYLCCAKGIFHHRDMRVKYFLFGWGLPLLIVVISLAARFPDYGNGPQYSCWLSINHGLIWAFLGPMIVIVVLNIGVMGLVIKCFLTLQANSEKTEAARLRGSLRAMMTLLPLLGISWILSLLVPFSVVFHYFFVIFNTLQGMCIFFLHCICNDEIRKKFYEKRRRWSTTRTGSDAEMNFPTRRKTGSFDAIRAAAVATPVTAEYASRTAWK